MSTKQIMLSSRKTRKSPCRPSKECQKQVTKLGHGARDTLDRNRLKINLGQMIARYKVDGKMVQAYEQVAVRLSALAGLSNGHSWGWRYIASVHSGTIAPSKKFWRVLALADQHISPRQRQWFYFARRRSVVAVYDKSILKEMIFTHMQQLGYRPVTFSRYAELKRRKHG